MVMPIVEAVLQQILKAKKSGCSGKDNPNLQLEESGVCPERMKEPVCDEKIPDAPNETFIHVEIHTVSQSDAQAATKSFKFLWQCGGKMSEKEKAAKKVIEEEYNSLGAMRPQEIITGVVFVLMVLLWLTRSPGFMPGWASLFPNHSGYMTDSTVALMLGFLLFIIPAYGPSRKYEAMISWEEFQALMPWKVALLVGGGFALAEGTKESGLSLWVAELLTPLGNLPVLATITIASIIVTTMTELTSNAATSNIFLPILAPLAEAIHVNPLYVLIPTTLCTSFSFLLPVSNPPNAVVFSYGHISILDMVKAGLGVNVIGLLAVMLAVGTWGVPLFSLNTYPDWAPVLPGFNSTMP
uniref:Solute carrier family 13 (Sodium/sulphate symporters), member 1 n=1 Tax=Nothobranchius furzeri TaxID=105023 RepID=A0A1A7ZGK4_NOTFU